MLTQEQDVFRWNLDPKGQFSVKSHCSALIHQDVPNLNKIIWKTKAPLKIKNFMWYLRRGVILCGPTKEHKRSVEDVIKDDLVVAHSMQTK
jgi:hypothetical protein